MSLIAETLADIPPALVDDTVELLKAIFTSSDSKAALLRARAAVITDAADAATDEDLRLALAADSGVDAALRGVK